MFRIAVLSSILFFSASSGLSAEQALPPPENDVIIPQDEYVMIPKSVLKAWHKDVTVLMNQYKAVEEQNQKLKSIIGSGMGCT